ncbi:uncharacterized protein [Clytia hemisphaerica]|uniref:SUEL-type lectin domain-containing protein n=1 Tax=Clytia hemisphaerica TaxID=252671 RepID=A0A7M5WKA1_9CNID
MTGQILCSCLVLNLIVLISCHPAKAPKERDRRQLMMMQDPGLVQEEVAYMKEWADQPVELGFFVNSRPAGDSDEPAQSAARRNLITDKPSAHDEGSGAGSEFRRDEILKKPTAPLNNDEMNTLTGEVRSKLEKSKPIEQSVEDPGDRRKARSSVTCQGQKEWIQCDGPYELIKIQDAFWGRDDTQTCTKSDVARGFKTGQKCVQESDNVMKKVREACDNENVCEVVASNIYFDQTDCPDVYKFLRLKWQCAPSESRIKETA